MTDLQKATLRASEIRSRLNELAGTDDLSDEQSQEVDTLTTEYRTTETRIRALTVAGDEPQSETSDDDPGERELRTMIDDANIGRIFAASVERRTTDGVEAELQQHFDLNANQIPLDLLRERRDVTPPPDNVERAADPVIMPIFAQGVAAFLGIPMPTVASGEAVYPILTNRPDVRGPYTASEVAGETTGSFEADTLAPERLQASFFYRRSDAARFASMPEALRSALSMGLMEAHDAQVLIGAGHGLLNGTVLSNNNVNAVTTYAQYVSRLAYDRVDGRRVTDVSGVKIVMGSAAYSDAAQKYRANESDRHALQRLSQDTGGVRVSAFVPAAAASKQNVLVRLGDYRDYVAPIWEGVTLIPDEVTKASTGEIVVTAVMLCNWKLLRADGFHKQQVQVGE